MRRHQQINFITDKLGELKNKVEIKSSINLTDINIIAEDFFCTLLNLLYGYNLKNLNFDKSNAASIDLGDVDKKIAIQITSTKTAAKIQKTVSKFIENELYKTYDSLVILFIVHEYKPKDKSYGGINFKFDSKKNVLDLKSLTKKINSIKDEELDRVYEFFVRQFSCLNPTERRIPQRFKVRIQSFMQAYLGTANTTVPFGGRESEIAHLNKWLESNDSSNLLLTSPAGRGKSALVVQWLSKLPTDWQLVFAPISVRFETSSASVFYELLAGQLADILDISLTASEYDSVNYYKEKVYEFVQLVENATKKILIVVDGLDEASGWQVSEMLLPEFQSKSVKILASARLIRANTFGHFAKRVQSLNEVNNVNKENPQNTYR